MFNSKGGNCYIDMFKISFLLLHSPSLMSWYFSNFVNYLKSCILWIPIIMLTSHPHKLLLIAGWMTSSTTLPNSAWCPLSVSAKGLIGVDTFCGSDIEATWRRVWPHTQCFVFFFKVKSGVPKPFRPLAYQLDLKDIKYLNVTSI